MFYQCRSSRFSADARTFSVEPLEPRALLSGNGLSATYFDNTDLTGAMLARTDVQVNFDWSRAAPVSATGSNYAVRWSGRVQARFSEQYRLIGFTAGGVRLWVNNTLVMNDWSPHALRSSSGYFNFEAGQRYSLRLEYQHTTSPADQGAVRLYWESASQSKQVIPTAFLYSSPLESAAPSVPTRLRPSYLTDTTIKMVWDAATDASGFVYYDVYLGSTKLDTVTDTSYTRAGRVPGTTYSFTVMAVDAFGNLAGTSKMVTTASPAPSAGGTGFASKYYSGINFDNFHMTRTDASIDFNWSGAPVTSSDGSYSVLWQGYIVPRYSEVYSLYFTSDDGARIYINNNLLIDDWDDHAQREASATMYLRAGTKYSAKVEYHNTSGPGRAQFSWASLSQAKQAIPASQVTTPYTDKTAPTAPGGLQVTGVTSNSVSLDWNDSSDDVGVASYDVYSGTQKIANVETSSYTNSGLSPGTLYQYKIVALDGAAHSSAASASVSATTQATPTIRESLDKTFAGSYDAASGITRSGNNVTNFDSGDWIRFSNVDFHNGVGSVKITLAVPIANVGGTVELRLDSTSGPLIGSLVVQPTGSFATYYVQQTGIAGANGVHALYLLGRNRANLANLQAIQFSTKSLVRIMPLGDSITQEFSTSVTWRYYLWQALQDAGQAVDFVGSQTQATDGYTSNLDFDQDHEGHSGWTTSQILAQVQSFASSANPDVVLIHLGTNDLRAGKTPQSAINNLGDIIDVLRSVNPNVKILLAQIIPCGDAPAGSVQAFNNLIPGLASSKSTGQSPVVVVDQYTGFSLGSDSDDSLHPNDAGDRMMADRWNQKLDQLL